MDFKGEKEAFVSGLSGTSIWEIYLILSTSSIGLIVRHVGILCSERVSRWHQNYFLYVEYSVYIYISLSFISFVIHRHSICIILLEWLLLLMNQWTVDELMTTANLPSSGGNSLCC